MIYLWIALSYFMYRIIVTAIENERITKVAKIEAKLKQELMQRYSDPGAVERILSSKLHDPHSMRHRVEHEDGAEQERLASMEGAASTHTHEEQERKARDGHLLGGLISFLLGLAFCASAWLVNIEPLYIPGLLLGAIGLALLTFATSQQEIAKVTQRKEATQG